MTQRHRDSLRRQQILVSQVTTRCLVHSLYLWCIKDIPKKTQRIDQERICERIDKQSAVESVNVPVQQVAEQDNDLSMSQIVEEIVETTPRVLEKGMPERIVE